MTSMKQHLCRELMTSMRGVMKLLVLSRAMDVPAASSGVNWRAKSGMRLLRP